MDYNYWLYPFFTKADKSFIQFIIISAMALNKKEVADDLEPFNFYSY